MIALHLACDASAPGVARAAMQNALLARPVALRDTAVLLADEIVTNALVHSKGAIELTVEDNAEGIRVEVSDTSVELPLVRTAKLNGEHGRGMLIVDSLASSWGVIERPEGKSVWFQLDGADYQNRSDQHRP